MTETTLAQLTALGEHLTSRREAILVRLRAAAEADPKQTTVSSLTRAQFNDHIPQLLDAFALKLRSRPGSNRAAVADAATAQQDVKHGLQRWQQGYDLSELTHEWAHLHACLADEIEAFAASSDTIERATLATAYRELIQLIGEGVNESVTQYTRMERAEAAGHVRDLQQALTKVNEIERRRAKMIHQAVHDLRTDVQSVRTAAEILSDADIVEAERQEFAGVVRQGVEAVGAMLGELMTLARLEAGQERRQITAFDAAARIRELCAVMQPMAAERNLSFKTDGPAALPVQGDERKVRRLVQNLISNALKYTIEGAVTVSWGEEKESWWVTVQDTGPGLKSGPSAPIADGIRAATDTARETDEREASALGEEPTVLPRPDDGVPAQVRPQQPGEGIGLSIVKRLCELLDASLEMTSSAESGTAFRVLFPRSYH